MAGGGERQAALSGGVAAEAAHGAGCGAAHRALITLALLTQQEAAPLGKAGAKQAAPALESSRAGWRPCSGDLE